MWEFAIKYPFLFTAIAVFAIIAARDVLVGIFIREEREGKNEGRKIKGEG